MSEQNLVQGFEVHEDEGRGNESLVREKKGQKEVEEEELYKMLCLEESCPACLQLKMVSMYLIFFLSQEIFRMSWHDARDPLQICTPELRSYNILILDLIQYSDI